MKSWRARSFAIKPEIHKQPSAKQERMLPSASRFTDSTVLLWIPFIVVYQKKPLINNIHFSIVHTMIELLFFDNALKPLFLHMFRRLLAA